MGENQKTVDYFTLESMALGKEINKAKMIDCEDKGRKRIVAFTVRGASIVTPCADEREVKKSFTIIANYLRWSKDIVMEEKAKGIELWNT